MRFNLLHYAVNKVIESQLIYAEILIYTNAQSKNLDNYAQSGKSKQDSVLPVISTALFWFDNITSSFLT